MSRSDLPEPVRLVFALHFHQPYGNLDEVFADAVDRCYLRTLELLGAHPHVAAAIHVSGPLLEWAENHRPKMIDELAHQIAIVDISLDNGRCAQRRRAISERVSRIRP